MTIGEYLGQLPRLKARAEGAYDRCMILEGRAAEPRSSLNICDGIPTGRNIHAVEDRVLTYADAAKVCREAFKEYNDFRDSLSRSIDNLLFWEGSLITQVYINNVVLDREDRLEGADEILRTKSGREIEAKLDAAKQHLLEILREEGKIDDTESVSE